jgi:hypothetical protein
LDLNVDVEKSKLKLPEVDFFEFLMDIAFIKDPKMKSEDFINSIMD